MSKRLIQRQCIYNNGMFKNKSKFVLDAIKFQKAQYKTDCRVFGNYNRFSTTTPQSAPSTNNDNKNASNSIVPGLVLSGVVMHGGFTCAEYLGQGLMYLQGIQGASPISGIPCAILLGAAISNSTSIPKYFSAGIQTASKPILQLGVICVGAKLSAVDLVATGIIGLPVVCTSIAVGLTFVPWLGKKLGLSPKTSSLIAAGTSICGVTAISALAPAIKANQQETSFAIANVVAFGTLGMLMYPYAAHAIFSNSQQIGMFLGLAVHDTSQVIGSALTYSAVYNDDEVLRVATITKLTRNLFLAGVIPGLTMVTARNENAPGSAPGGRLLPTMAEFKKYFPAFVGGFIGMSLARTAGDMSLASYGSAFGVIDPQSWKMAMNFIGNDLGSHYLLGTAMAAVGLSTNISNLRGVGAKPFALGFAGAAAVGLTGFTTSMVVGSFL